jgi:transposase
MLTAIYYILRDGVDYRELGGHHFGRLDRTKTTQRLVKRLRDLDYRVQLAVVAA